MQHSSVIIIFAKNQVPGKVKTRLAATIGNDKALEVYQTLLQHTSTVCQLVNARKVVYYSDQEENSAIWGSEFAIARQQGGDLGERMKNAFSEVLGQGYQKAVIIGTDCPGIDGQILQAALDALTTHEVVVGPAFDGGYYLLGMKVLYHALFENIAWSTSSVCETTLAKCRDLNLEYFLLPTLHDVDEEKDLVHLQTLVT